MDILQVNSEEGRYYEVTKNGKKRKHPSVTTLISHFKPKGALIKWRQKIGEDAAKEITEKAASRGTKVHGMVEKYFHQRESGRLASFSSDSVTNEESSMWTRLLPVLQTVKPIYIEQKTSWEQGDFGFAGTLDICGILDGSKYVSRESGVLDESIPFVGDWKTWNKPKYPVAKTAEGTKYYPLISYFLQLSAYCAAVNQNTNCQHKLNRAFIFGVTENCRQPFIYYLNANAVNFYWGKMKQLVECYYLKTDFDWAAFEREAEGENLLGERVDLIC